MTHRYLADSTHGKLAKWLRLLGIDVELFERGDLASLVKRARAMSRKIITGRKRPVDHPAVFIQPGRVEKQVEDFFAKEGLKLLRDRIFTRCSVCNKGLEEIDSDMAAERGVPEFVLFSHEQFLACNQCNRVYWPGSHRERFMERLKNVNIPGKGQ